jgi:uncharacterized protein involved in exopolysaccharide biosynthesis
VSEEKNVAENEIDTAAKAQSTPQGDDDEISLVDLAATLWRRKWMILIVTSVAGVLSVVYALMQPNVYTASSTMLPISGSSSSLLSQYAGLASLAGVSLPGSAASDPTVKIEAILKSREFAEKVVSDMNLVPVLIKNPEKIKVGTPLSTAVDLFQKSVFKISTDAKTSLMTISATTKNPKLSSDIANKATNLIQDDLQARTLSASGKSIIILEQQVADQEKKVRNLQAKMTAYQKKSKLISPTTQSQGGLAMYQGLIQQKIALEIEISRLESALSSDNPKIVADRTELDAIKAQIANFEKTGGGVGPSMNDTPAALMEYANLTAELEMATQLYGGLLASLENMRLQEASDKVFVEVIDKAVTPDKKSAPSRSMICVVGIMAGAFLAVLLAFVLDAMGKLVADPEVRSKFASVKKGRGVVH